MQRFPQMLRNVVGARPRRARRRRRGSGPTARGDRPGARARRAGCSCDRRGPSRSCGSWSRRPAWSGPSSLPTDSSKPSNVPVAAPRRNGPTRARERRLSALVLGMCGIIGVVRRRSTRVPPELASARRRRSTRAIDGHRRRGGDAPLELEVAAAAIEGSTPRSEGSPACGRSSPIAPVPSAIEHRTDTLARACSRRPRPPSTPAMG